jgi:hypothetical protein
VTPATANRTITFPDATGTLGLVAGSTGQAIYNDAGAYSGLSTVTTDGTNVTLTGRFIGSLNGAASAPPATLTGTWFTGGTATTTKPQLLLEPAGTTSTAWSTSGTGIGVNAASGFAGNLLDLQVNGTSQLTVNSSGTITGKAGSTPSAFSLGEEAGHGTLRLSRTGVSGARFSILPVAAGTTISDTGNAGITITATTANSFVHIGNARLSGGQNPNTGRTFLISADENTIRDRNGSNLQLQGGDGGATNRNGGDVIIEGGLNTGTGTAGNIVIGATRGNLQITDARNVVLGTTTGTKIGTATTQKLGFYNATPVVQPAAVADITTTATAGTLPTADGSVTVADADAPTNAELLEYCVELEAKLEAALAHLRTLGLIAT